MAEVYRKHPEKPYLEKPENVEGPKKVEPEVHKVEPKREKVEPPREVKGPERSDWGKTVPIKMEDWVEMQKKQKEK